MYRIQAELERAGGVDNLLGAFHSTGNIFPLDDGSVCFAAQLTRVLFQLLQAVLPLISASPPNSRKSASGSRLPLGLQHLASGAIDHSETEIGSKSIVEVWLSESLYALAASTFGLLGTLAGHGAISEGGGEDLYAAAGICSWTGKSRGDGRDRGGAKSDVSGISDVKGERWVKEIASGLAGVGGGLGNGFGTGGGGGIDSREFEMLDACWAVVRNVDGVQGEGMGISACASMVRCVPMENLINL